MGPERGELKNKLGAAQFAVFRVIYLKWEALRGLAVRCALIEEVFADSLPLFFDFCAWHNVLKR